MTNPTPILIYDGKCGFCGIWINYWKQLTADRVRYAPSQEVGPQFPQISPEEFKKSVWLVLPNGEQFHGAEAVFRLMALAPGKRWPLWLYRHLPGFAPVTEAAYRVVAAHRNVFYWITRLLWGKKVEPETYGRSSSLFLRGLAIVYFIAFLSLIPQIAGLIGAHGIQPVNSYLDAIRSQTGSERYWEAPTLLWLGSSDAILKIICWTGAGIAALVAVGIAPWPGLFGAWLLYLSIVTVGQDFLSFQWDSLLLEAGFAALLIAPWGIRPRYTREPSIPGRWVIRLLLFRLMLESGLVKLLSGDPSWRNLTALTYHYETQPLPTPLAWYAHHLPAWFQTMSTAGVFVIELALPFLFLMPRRFRLIGAWTTISLQLCIAATGNYTFFNLLTILLCISLFDDRHLRRSPTPAGGARPWPVRAVNYGIAALLIVLGLAQLGAMAAQAESFPAPLAWLDRQAETFRLMSSYGLFAVMTTSRPEIIVEGSNDGEHWEEYQFKFKADDPRQRPRWVAPYQPRLDWQMWFASLSGYRNTPWFSSLAFRLLQGSPEVLELFKTNPFPNHPPQYIRAELYDYHFSDSATRQSTGAWWTREYAGEYLAPASIRSQ